MRLIVLGVDAEGRSCVASQSDLPFVPVPGLPGSRIAKLFETHQSPPPPRPRGFARTNPDTIPPGHVNWFVLEHAAGADRTADTEMHNRNAIDLVVILEGGGQLGLSDGPHQVQAGDCIVMGGIDHYSMRPGPQGCRAMSFAIGTPPPE